MTRTPCPRPTGLLGWTTAALLLSSPAWAQGAMPQVPTQTPEQQHQMEPLPTPEAVERMPAPAVPQPTPAQTNEQMRTPDAAPDAAERAPGPASLKLAEDPRLGPYLVDGQGRTLYGFAADRKGAAQTDPLSTCTGDCAAAWPPLTTSAQPATGDGLSAEAAGAVPREDGSLQATWHGLPLYTYAKEPTGTGGHGLTDFGGPWFLVTPDGRSATGNTPSDTVSPNSQTPGAGG
ncbi:hypothetical protein [Zavarzinia sp. CC-PAN008]|uniref:COG4315 family predicted lipoprotein n=1 Tax=Zavarzinia sp. CC-PAN008 TaxID=3243332 RepID=UPI003F74376E